MRPSRSRTGRTSRPQRWAPFRHTLLITGSHAVPSGKRPPALTMPALRDAPGASTGTECQGPGREQALGLVFDRRPGEPAESTAGTMPPGQDGIRQAEFGGPFGDDLVGRFTDRGPGQGQGHRQIEPEHGVLGVGQCLWSPACPGLMERLPEAVGRHRVRRASHVRRADFPRCGRALRGRRRAHRSTLPCGTSGTSR